MINHFVILSSSYSTGCRIAMDLPFDGRFDKEVIDPILHRIRNCYGGEIVSMGWQMLQTQSTSWESVVKSDPYFEDVRLIETVDEFIDLIKRDEFLESRTVGEYILNIDSCDRHRAEILTYLCYADFLVIDGRRMFRDRILAVDDGPAPETLRSALENGRYREDEDGKIIPNVEMLAIRSKITFASGGYAMANSIDATVRRFSDVDTDTLCEIVTGEGSPWRLCLGKEEISDGCIRSGHGRE